MALPINANASANLTQTLRQSNQRLSSTVTRLSSGASLNSNSSANSSASVADNLKAVADREKLTRDSVSIQNLNTAPQSKIANIQATSSGKSAYLKDPEMAADSASEMASLTKFNMMVEMGVAKLAQAQGRGSAQTALSLLK